VKRVEGLVTDSTEEEVLGELNFFRSFLYYWQGRSKDCVDTARKAQKMLPAESILRADAEVYIGFSQQMMGQSDLALRELSASAQGTGQQDVLHTTRIIATQSFVHLLSGELTQSKETAIHLERLAKKNNLRYGMLWGTYLRGSCSFEQYKLDKADQQFGLVADNKYIFHTRTAVSCLAGLALTYALMKCTEEAERVLGTLFRFASESTDPYNLDIAYSCQARLSILSGDVGNAESWLRRHEEYPDAPSMVFFLEIPCITRCRVLIAKGSYASLKEAGEKLEVLRNVLEPVHNTFQLIDIGVLRALAYGKQGLRDEAVQVLKEVVALAQPGGWIRPFVEAGPDMANLLKQLAKRKIAVDYIGKILGKLRSKKTGTLELVTDDQTVRPALSGMDSLVEPLSKREVETLSLLGKGLSNKKIAGKLILSPETVKKHVYNIYQKLYVKSRVSAIAKAKKLGILPPG